MLDESQGTRVERTSRPIPLSDEEIVRAARSLGANRTALVRRIRERAEQDGLVWPDPAPA